MASSVRQGGRQGEVVAEERVGGVVAARPGVVRRAGTGASNPVPVVVRVLLPVAGAVLKVTHVWKSQVVEWVIVFIVSLCSNTLFLFLNTLTRNASYLILDIFTLFSLSCCDVVKNVQFLPHLSDKIVPTIK